jgi:hypothetical protein
LSSYCYNAAFVREETIAMRNEKGSAIVIVLLVVGIISVAGVGLLIQSKFDTRFTSSLRSYDKVFNLADGGSYLASEAVAYVETGPMGTSGGGISKMIYENTEDQKIEDRGSWTAAVCLRGYDTRPQEISGWELGVADGFHTQHWVATGTGGKDGGDGAQAVVQIATLRINRN